MLSDSILEVSHNPAALLASGTVGGDVRSGLTLLQVQPGIFVMVERVAGGEGFEPPTSGSGGLCPIQARLPAQRMLSRHESEIINYGLWLRRKGT